jgi:hypothetical protein
VNANFRCRKTHDYRQNTGKCNCVKCEFPLLTRQVFSASVSNVQLMTLDCSLCAVIRTLVLRVITRQLQSRVLIDRYILQNKTDIFSVHRQHSPDFTLEMRHETNRQCFIKCFDISFFENPFSGFRFVCTFTGWF